MVGMVHGWPDGASPSAETTAEDAGAALTVRVPGGVRLHVRRWLPERGNTDASLVFLHGIASHSGWLDETARFLANRGIAVYAPDRRGSGRSEGVRGHLDSCRQALDDLDRVLAQVQREQPGRPIFLAGSSWAAKLAIAYAAVRQDRLAGLLLPYPGLAPRIGLTLGRRLLVLVAYRVWPRLRLAIPLTPEQYTAELPRQDFVRRDPLRLLTATARFFWETGRLDRRRDRLASRLRLPLLLQIGDADLMMDVQATRRWFERIGSADRAMVVYPGAGHTLDFEPDPAPYRADLLAWMLAHLSSSERSGGHEGGYEGRYEDGRGEASDGE
ncbi:MAG: alpha/beta fold hydrolase [Chloroflexi bacterium]|nr:alpha/beta fold hydrolase [Chloroflexota bacterium]